MQDFNSRLKKVALQTGGYGNFARQINIKVNAACKYLDGKAVPSVEVLKKISEACNVSLNWLILGIGEQKIFEEPEQPSAWEKMVAESQKIRNQKI